jgi:hypothetical protein
MDAVDDRGDGLDGWIISLFSLDLSRDLIDCVIWRVD